jgi:hypothetical protein
VALAALLAQPHPEPAVLRVDILDRHAERRADPGERIDHEPDQGAVAQAGLRRDIDAVEQRARFGGIEHRRLPGRHDVARPAHRVRRVDRHDLAVDQPIEQVAERGEPLLDARRGQLARRASIQVATCSGWTAAIDGTPALAHQARNSSAAR